MTETIIYMLLALIAVVISNLISANLRKTPGGEQQNWLKKKLLTGNELKCFHAVNHCIDADQNISCKVRLTDLIEPEKRLKKSEWHKQFNRIKSKHIDFVITDKNTMNTIIAIELDDSSHRRNGRRDRDDFINACLKSANIRLLRLNSYKTYMPERIKPKILEIIQYILSAKVWSFISPDYKLMDLIFCTY